jgi:recombinational DNA repair protein (RecF pathway)
MKNNNYLKERMKCECANCGQIVSKDPRKHFSTFDGRILCNKCCKGMKPANDIIKKWLIDDYKKNYTRSDF